MGLLHYYKEAVLKAVLNIPKHSKATNHCILVRMAFFLFFSLGCIIFFGLCLFAAALWFIFTCTKKKTVQGAELIRSEEHFKMKEDIEKGPHGKEAVALSVEKDKRFEEDFSATVKKSEEIKNTGHIETGESSSMMKS